jgi:hypothetical protein
MTPTQHLTEDERQSMADGTLLRDANAAAFAHVEQCAECADDVTRIRTLMTRAKETAAAPPDLNELWPAIRGRIEERKVIPLGIRDTIVPRNLRRAAMVGAFLTPLVAAIAFIVISVRGATVDKSPPQIDATVSEISLASATDSARIYEQEAQELLGRLELQRAMMRPEVAKAFEHDMRVVDDAIAELKTEIARQPGNVALLRLLASSYHRKVDLLTRAGNAG